MNPLTDFHTHSRFSLDSDIATENMVKAAIEAKLSHICITEHKDTDPWYEDVYYYRDKPYSREMKKLKTKYSGTIKVLKGVEIDCQKAVMEEILTFLNTCSFDFVLASVHVLKHRFFDTSYFEDYDALQTYHDYLDELLELSRQTFFDVMGHIDYVKRFGYCFLPFNPFEFEEKYREILKNLIDNGKGIELNTAGWRHPHGECYPSETILKWYKELGGDVITLGSDAHTPEDVGSRGNEARMLLQKLGFDGLWVFEDRNGRKIPFE